MILQFLWRREVFLQALFLENAEEPTYYATSNYRHKITYSFLYEITIALNLYSKSNDNFLLVHDFNVS